MDDPEAILTRVLKDYDVTVLDNEGPDIKPRQTKAKQTLVKLLEQHGEGHLQDVLTCFLHTENNAMALLAPIIKAVSSLLRAHPEWWRRDTTAWLEVLDRIDLNRLHTFVKGNMKAVPADKAIATELYRELAGEFAPPTPELFDERYEGASA
ncbi:hypothetical protein DLJ53_18095 [Acuticoccus sediminis]|uniref:Uncharacterized protein n=1 Tax=Acuticoccus sediminis TaxID=2184697 RepID=A0A8B2NZ93_9HYPH|nr:hypothetical protein [Acuticoccus sediminis]RAI01128.1 hypothetical protein DLJ53_18095 [Acuticoccus sediminis]